MDRLIKIARRVGLAIVALSAVLYAADYLSVRHRMTKKTAGDPLDSMKIQRTYVIPHKDGRAEIIFGEPETQVCVHSLFPHMGYTPCWYLKRQAQKTQIMGIILDSGAPWRPVPFASGSAKRPSLRQGPRSTGRSPSSAACEGSRQFAGC